MKDWNNIDLRSHEVDSALIDEYTFDTLLLEIKCNVKEITPENGLKTPPIKTHVYPFAILCERKNQNFGTAFLERLILADTL